MVITRYKHNSCGKGNLISTRTSRIGDFALVNLYTCSTVESVKTGASWLPFERNYKQNSAEKVKNIP